MRILKNRVFLLLLVMLSVICFGNIVIAESLETLELPQMLQIIDEEAFYGDSSIEKVMLPESIKEIRSKAFANSSVSQIYLCSSLEFIADNAFDGCENVKITADVGTYAYDWALTHGYIDPPISTQYEYKIISETTVEITKYIGNDSCIYMPDLIEDLPVTKIADSAFANCDSVLEIVLPDGLTSIGKNAFSNCSKLTSVSIPSRSTIESYAFYGCSSLNKIIFWQDDGIAFIKDHAFDGCSSLTSVALPNGTYSIGSSAFENCISLTNITLPDSIQYINSRAFYNCNSLISINIPDTVRSIDDYLFYNCSSLTNITIPESVKNIGQRAFYGCSSLTSIIIPDGMKTILWETFYGCSSITNISIPDSVTAIREKAFFNCSNLISVTIPDSVTVIEQQTFFGCSSLTDISLPKYITTIDRYTFTGCSSLTDIIVPEGVTSVGEAAFSGCKNLRTIVLPDSVSDIGMSAFSGCSSLLHFDIPCNVTSISQWAFNKCTSLTSITIPDGVTAIEYQAFTNCSSLKDLNLPDSIVHIGQSAFYNCSSIGGHLNLPENLQELESDAFGNCTNIHTIVIPKGVTTISAYLFRGCDNLTKVILPKGVTSIKHSVFPTGVDGKKTIVYACANSYAEDWVKTHWKGYYKIYTRESTYYGGKENGSDEENLQSTWEAIDKYKNGDHRVFDIYLNYEEEYPPYLFELFVQEYQKDIVLQASVATSEIVNAIKNGISDTVALAFGDIDTDSLWSLLDEDKKVAQAIVDYLVTTDVNVPNVPNWQAKFTSDTGEFLRKWFGKWAENDVENTDEMITKWNELVKWADNALARLELEGAVLSTEEIRIANIMKDKKFTGYSDENLAAIISQMEFVEARTGKTYVFADMLDVNSGNARSISKKISSMSKQTANGKTVSFTVGDDWGTNVKWSFRVDVEKTLNPSNEKTIYEYIEDKRSEVESKARELETENPEAAAKWNNAFKGALFSKWIFDAVLEGMDAYEQAIEYEAVLAVYEKELRDILRNTDCKNIDAVVNEVLSILREGTANSVVYAVEEGIEKLFCDLMDDMISDAFGDVLKKALPNANPLTMFFNFGTDVAMLVCDASNTKLRVWGVEDLYDDYLAAKQDLINAMDVFYADPTLDTFNQLYYTAKYYALIVRSSSNQVSIILKSEAESFKGLIQSFFDKISVEERVQYAEDIPITDELDMISFLDMLFPTAVPI